jgi:hypothetical protein
MDTDLDQISRVDLVNVDLVNVDLVNEVRRLRQGISRSDLAEVDRCE